MTKTRPLWLRLAEHDKRRIKRIARRDERSVAYILKQAALEYAKRREADHGRAK